MSQNKLTSILATIKDSDLGLTIHELGMEVDASFNDNILTLSLHAGFPTKHLETTLRPQLINTIESAFKQCRTNIEFTYSIKSHRTQLVGQGLRGVKNTIAIASGKGGVGKSTITVNLATSLAKMGAKVGILDADIYGPSIPLMLGKTEPVKIDGAHYLPVQAHNVQAMSIAYLTDSDQALIWRGPMLAKSFLQMLNLTLWDNLDYLFIDLPPGTGDIQLSLVQKIPLTGAIVVTTPQNVATIDAAKAIKMFQRTGIDLLGIIENMSSQVCNHCGHVEDIFGTGGASKLCSNFETILLGQIPLDSHIRSQSDEGLPSSIYSSSALQNIFMKTAMKTAVTLSKKPINYADKFPPIKVE